VDRLERADFVAVGVERDFARGDGLDPNLKRGVVTDRVDQIVEVVFGPRRAVDRQGLPPGR